MTFSPKCCQLLRASFEQIVVHRCQNAGMKKLALILGVVAVSFALQAGEACSKDKAGCDKASKCEKAKDGSCEKAKACCPAKKQS